MSQDTQANAFAQAWGDLEKKYQKANISPNEMEALKHTFYAGGGNAILIAQENGGTLKVFEELVRYGGEIGFIPKGKPVV